MKTRKAAIATASPSLELSPLGNRRNQRGVVGLLFFRVFWCKATSPQPDVSSRKASGSQ